MELQSCDAIDFTDNDIQTLGGFPLSPRLRTLLLARNRINAIQPNLATSLPGLTTLVLTANNFAELADLDVLGTFPMLTHLVLNDNPVTRKDVCYPSACMNAVELILATALPILDLVEMSEC